MRTIVLLISLWLASVYSLGQTKLSPYTRFCQSTRQKWQAAGTDSIQSDAKIPVFVFLTSDYIPGEFDDWDIQVHTVTDDILTADISLRQLQAFAQLDRVKYIETGSPVYNLLDKAKSDTGADKMKNGEELPQEFRGKGVIIGIIDNGFDYGHADFWTSDKKELRIRRVWDQNKTGENPEGFTYGIEYDSQEEILAAAYDNTTQTHGTHVAGIAAGADTTDGHNFAGVASDAEIVLVALNTSGMENGDNTKVIDGINYIYGYAESQGKPCVINLSLGSHLGPRDGTSAFDQMADKLQGPGRLLVGSVGNDGGSRCHVAQHLTSNQKDTLKAFFDFKYNYPQYMTMEVWATPEMDLTFIPFIYNTTLGTVTTTGEPFNITGGDSKKSYSFSLEADGIPGSLDLFAETSPFNQRPHLLVNCNFYQTEGYRPGFFITSGAEGTVHAWADNLYGQFSNMGIEGFTDGNDTSTMGEIGGSGKRIISVGAYTTRNHSQNMGIIYPSGETEGDIASFSSGGPTPDGRTKPEITAPGTYIVSALSNHYSGSKLVEKRIEWNGTKYSFGYMQGTSMASPFVAGVLAAWLQAYPQLSPEEVRETLRLTAIQDDYTGEIAANGNDVWGSGKLDAWNGLKECIRRATGLNALPADIEPITVYTDSHEIRLLSTGTSHNVNYALYGMQGMLWKQGSRQFVNPGEEIRIPTTGLETGLYLLNITTDEGFSTNRKIVINP